MRRFLMLMSVAIAAGLLPAAARAESPNQAAAGQIAAHIRSSGQMSSDYKVAVRYLDGTVWLQGHVHDQDQMDKAVALVFSSGVTIDRVIKDDLKIDDAMATPRATAAASTKMILASNSNNPLRGSSSEKASSEVNRAQQVSASFNGSHKATPVSMMQPVPVPPVPAPAPVQARPVPVPHTEATAGVPGAPMSLR